MRSSVVNNMALASESSRPVLYYQHYMELAFIICHGKWLTRVFEDFGLPVEGFLEAVVSQVTGFSRLPLIIFVTLLNRFTPWGLRLFPATFKCTMAPCLHSFMVFWRRNLGFKIIRLKNRWQLAGKPARPAENNVLNWKKPTFWPVLDQLDWPG